MAPWEKLLAALLLASASAMASAPTRFATLPESSIIAALRADRDGNLFVTGSVNSAHPASPDDRDAFLAKLSADGAQLLYWTVWGGSGADSPHALALDPDTGAVFVTGTTESRDLPGATHQAFVTGIGPAGDIRYNTFLGAAANTTGDDIAYSSDGAVIVTGQTTGEGFPSTAGAAVSSDASTAGYLAKLDASGSKLIFALRGVGGGRIQTDSAGNIYLAGITYTNDIPTTPGALQSSHDQRVCFANQLFSSFCAYTYVAKLNPDASQLLFSTFLTGSWGSTPAALHVNDDASVTIAGNTNSPDFPTTPGAPVEHYLPPPQAPFFPPTTYPPPAVGFLSTLNASGAALVSSTFISGTKNDTISDMLVTGDAIYLAGQAGSPDLPGLGNPPSQCLPRGYLARLSPDGRTVSGTELLNQPAGPFLAVAGSRIFTALAAREIQSSGADPQRDRIACIQDAALLYPTQSAAPGQLLTIFGNHLAEETRIAEPGAAGRLPVSLAAFAATLNGVPAPLLYVSPTQVNLQAPFELAGAETAILNLAGDRPRQLDTSAHQPTAFRDPAAQTACRGLTPPSTFVVVLNADGSRNTCESPAEPGAVVSVILDGLGDLQPAQPTGAIVTLPAPLLAAAVTFDPPDFQFVSANAVAGAVTGVWQIHFRIPQTTAGYAIVKLSIDGIAAAPVSLAFWVRKP